MPCPIPLNAIDAPSRQFVPPPGHDLQFLLQEMLRLVARLEINMHIRPLHIRQALELHLQILGHVVSRAQRLGGVHDHVHLDDDARAGVVRAHGVEGEDLRRVRHGDVRDPLLQLRVRRHADEQLELLVRRAQPEGGDEDGEDDGAHGVDPPADVAAADGHEDADAVDEHVVAVVFPQDVHLRVGALQRPAVAEQRELGAEGDGDDDDGGEVEGFRLQGAAVVVVGPRDAGARGGVAFGEFHGREDDEDEGDGGHEEAEDDVAGRFDAGFARGETAGIDFPDGAVAGDEGEVGHRVEDRVGHGGEERERAGVDGREDLQAGEDDVGGEGALDGDLELEVVLAIELLGEPDVLVYGAEPAFDILVLGLVEVLELPGLGGGLVGGDGAEAVAFAGGVGADEVEFAGGFELGGELIRVGLLAVVVEAVFEVVGGGRVGMGDWMAGMRVIIGVVGSFVEFVRCAGGSSVPGRCRWALIRGPFGWINWGGIHGDRTRRIGMRSHVCCWTE